MRLHVCVIASLSLSVSLSPSVSLLLTVSLSCSLSLFLLPPRRSFSLSLPQYHCLPSLLSVPVSVTFTLPVYLFVSVTHTFTLPTHHFASMPESLSVSLSLSLCLCLFLSMRAWLSLGILYTCTDDRLAQTPFTVRVRPQLTTCLASLRFGAATAA